MRLLFSMKENLIQFAETMLISEPLRKAIFEARYDDVPQYLDIAKAVEDFVEGDVEVRDEVVYYKGKHRLHGVVVDKLLEMLRSGMKDSTPITTSFLLDGKSGSSNSENNFYTFLGYKSLPITPQGMVRSYKGVKDDFILQQEMQIRLLYKVLQMNLIKFSMELARLSKFNAVALMITRIIIVLMVFMSVLMTMLLVGQEKVEDCF